MKYKTVLVPLTMPLVLAACLGGGGGSGGSGWRNFTSFENINPNQRVQFQSGGGSVNYAGTAAAPGASVDRAGTYSKEGARLRVRFGDLPEPLEGEDPDPDAIPDIRSLELRVNLPDGTVTRTFDGESIADVGGGLAADRFIVLEIESEPVGEVPAVVTDRLYVVDFEELGLEYMTFGLWELGLDGTSRNIGGAAFGALTPVSGTNSMPAIGTATYTGELIGYQVQATSTVVHVADSTLVADFAAPTVTFSSSGTRRLVDGVDASNLNIAPSPADITGNTFRGNVSLAGTDCCPGEFGGAFFGPEAAEAGGWFEVTNINPAEGFEDNLNDRYFGSFGGKRDIPPPAP